MREGAAAGLFQSPARPAFLAFFVCAVRQRTRHEMCSEGDISRSADSCGQGRAGRAAAGALVSRGREWAGRAVPRRSVPRAAPARPRTELGASARGRAAPGPPLLTARGAGPGRAGTGPATPVRVGPGRAAPRCARLQHLGWAKV